MLYKSDCVRNQLSHNIYLLHAIAQASIASLIGRHQGTVDVHPTVFSKYSLLQHFGADLFAMFWNGRDVVNETRGGYHILHNVGEWTRLTASH